ncbi:helix-turn-helix domain-containing protein [Rhodococcus sp. B10]|uniref:helix-turn-helix transcriptional regulator n=1 Tax=Rhodococcus sp. B10 TaxID=2695876 RepID=UPI003211D4C1
MAHTVQTDIEERFLTTKQVSEIYGIPEATLRYWRHVGEGPSSFVRGRRSVIYRRSEVDRWVTAQEAMSVRGGVA